MDYFEYENGFWMNAPINRYGKFIAHYQAYQSILNVPGDVLEFGVHKGNSMVRWLTLRDLFENKSTRRVFGFDMFGEFPSRGIDEVISDKEFMDVFASEDGIASPLIELQTNLDARFENFELIKGDIRQSVPIWLEHFENAGRRFALIHLDVDVFEPTQFTLDMFATRLCHNGIFVIDDYGFVEGASMAVDQFLGQNTDTFELARFSHVSNPVVLRKV